ncbi:siderophore-iron reductase FhuF [Diaphorobacter sp. HDW4A]|uniref:siderophore-iron reductase FhuF n=1 Tax=Betaproteobacteria TaxID=28216 RepID=UPI00140B556E|nr:MULTISPECIES: siderophore-iron reductase FhuF [Betaproteobacteria]MCK6394937.1 siderophore-iron reductase FhuF [Zoogloea sp.]QIL78937.1 siderophore-iron reductase FhuF [Diaphorobacter sp. HDW4A]
MILLLAPLFQGEWAAHGETLALASHWPSEGVPISRLVSHDSLLGDAIRRYATHLGVTGNDLRAAASAWSLDYLWALLPPTAAAASVLQHRFPMHADDVALSLNDIGTPVRFHIRHEGHAMPGTPATTRYAPLLEEHLDPLFKAIGRQTRLAQKILWGNAARYLEVILEQALALTNNADHIAADRETLLQQPTHPDGRPNPLYGRKRTAVHVEDGAASTITLHRQCCLFYRVPGQDYCGACPLAPAHRADGRYLGPTGQPD